MSAHGCWHFDGWLLFFLRLAVSRVTQMDGEMHEEVARKGNPSFSISRDLSLERLVILHLGETIIQSYLPLPFLYRAPCFSTSLCRSFFLSFVGHLLRHPTSFILPGNETGEYRHAPSPEPEALTGDWIPTGPLTLLRSGWNQNPYFAHTLNS